MFRLCLFWVEMVCLVGGAKDGGAVVDMGKRAGTLRRAGVVLKLGGRLNCILQGCRPFSITHMYNTRLLVI